MIQTAHVLNIQGGESQKTSGAWEFSEVVGSWDVCMGVEPKIGAFYPQNRWFIMVPNPIKMDDLGGKTPYFWKYPYIYLDLPKGVPHGSSLRGILLRHPCLVLKNWCHKNTRKTHEYPLKINP